MEIKDKTPNDPIASLYLVDAYMRWALLAAEEVVGKQGLPFCYGNGGSNGSSITIRPSCSRSAAGLPWVIMPSFVPGC